MNTEKIFQRTVIKMISIVWMIVLLPAVNRAGTPHKVPGQINAKAADIRYAGKKAELSIVRVSNLTVEVQLTPIGDDGMPAKLPPSDILIDYPRIEIWKGRTVTGTVKKKAGELTIEISGSPLAVTLATADGKLIQRFSWDDNGNGAMNFQTNAPVFGLGEGGQSDHLDRRGFLHTMKDGNASYERATHGVYVAAPMLIGTDGWSLFVHQPINRGNAFDLRNGKGAFIPAPATLNQPLKFLVTIWSKPADVLTEYRIYAGKTPLPPIWALGYMQSHRTLSGTKEIMWVANNMRERNLPCDALIYLGTGFTPTGWNTGHNTFDFNTKIFENPPQIIHDLKSMNFNIVLHNYDPPRGLHGLSVDKKSQDTSDISSFWNRHSAVHNMGIDAWWPDGGEGLSSESRLARHRMYYLGPLHEHPNLRPWSLHRTGYSGVNRYGGWLWSGDPDSRWATLKTHIGIGLNHSLSLSPYWGSDIAGFVPTDELTGELYVRWFQFSAFTASFRGHGRTWHLRLPWGWDQGTIGPPESSIFDSENKESTFKKGYPYPNELRNALVEPITRQFLNLRYQLLPYNYTLTRETYDTGMPPMRAMWLHYPKDTEAANLSDQYMWGPSFLVAPVYEKGQTERKLYLPEGDWYDYWTNEKMEGKKTITRQVDLGTLPLYVKAGAIIPFDPVRQYTTQKVTGATTLKVYKGADGAYVLYEDDGSSQEYLKGLGEWTHISWNDKGNKLTIKPDPKSRIKAGTKTNKKYIVELLPEGVFKTVAYTGKTIEVNF